MKNKMTYLCGLLGMLTTTALHAQEQKIETSQAQVLALPTKPLHEKVDSLEKKINILEQDQLRLQRELEELKFFIYNKASEHHH